MLTLTIHIQKNRTNNSGVLFSKMDTMKIYFSSYFASLNSAPHLEMLRNPRLERTFKMFGPFRLVLETSVSR